MAEDQSTNQLSMSGFVYKPTNQIPLGAQPMAAPSAAVASVSAPVLETVQTVPQAMAPIAVQQQPTQVAGAPVQPVGDSVLPTFSLGQGTPVTSSKVFTMETPTPKLSADQLVTWAKYGQYSVVVYGAADPEKVKEYNDKLIENGAMYNGRLSGSKIDRSDLERFPGFIFKKNQIDMVADLVDQINTGQIEPVPYTGGLQETNSYSNNSRSNYKVPEGQQRMSFVIDKPSTDKRMLLNISNRIIPYEVTSITENPNKTFVMGFKAKPIEAAGDEVHVVMINGMWQIHLVGAPHTIMFEANQTYPAMPNTVPTIPGM